ncbi:hypothetical protein OROHE_000736 [Orobanche hederae]
MELIQEFEGKTIFITGATGSLAKIIVEKLLRVQPNVKKLLLLIRGSTARPVEQRLREEIIDSELFRVLKDNGGENILMSKVIPISGDVSHENLGITNSELIDEICGEIDFIINSAATTRFDESAFVHHSGSKLLLEESFFMDKTLKAAKAPSLDIEAEKMLVEEIKTRLQAQKMTDKELTFTLRKLGIERANFYGWPNTYSFTKAMGEMNLEKFKGKVNVVIIRPTIISTTFRDPFPGWAEGLRTLDSLFAAYAKGKLEVFLGDPNSTIDFIPSDMVVNCILVAMATHSNRHCNELLIYQVGSSLRNPIKYKEVKGFMYQYLRKNPLLDDKGKPINVGKILTLGSVASFHRYIGIRYLPFLEMLKLLNVIFCNHCGNYYTSSRRKIDRIMQLAELYKPYVFFQGIFDDANTENLRLSSAREKNRSNREILWFDFDPKSIQWEDYFIKTHFPGIVKYVLKQ